jgi:hypothetical protein
MVAIAGIKKIGIKKGVCLKKSIDFLPYLIISIITCPGCTDTLPF